MKREEMIKKIINILYKADEWCEYDDKYEEVANEIINTIIPEGAVLIDKGELEALRNDLINSECNLNHVTLQLEEESKKTAIEIIKEVKAFLDMQTQTVNELSNSNSRYAIPENCRDCYEGSQKNRIAELKRIAKQYGVEVK